MDELYELRSFAERFAVLPQAAGLTWRCRRKSGICPTCIIIRGLEKAEIRDLSGAIDLLKRSLKFNKLNIQARNLLGLVYF